jgi:hypothetical protein
MNGAPHDGMSLKWGGTLSQILTTFKNLFHFQLGEEVRRLDPADEEFAGKSVANFN